MSHQRVDGAIALLVQALATRNATRLDEAKHLWTDLHRQQAEEVLHAAQTALSKRNAVLALNLLQSYLDDPFGTQHDEAARLKEQLELGTSDSEAVAHLRRLPNDALADFANTGRLADLDGNTHPDVWAIHLQKLRGCVGEELRRRQDEWSRRMLRIRTMPVFGEFQELVALTRRRLQSQAGSGGIDHRLLGRLFAELNIDNAEEQRRIIMELSTRPLDHGEAEKIVRDRAKFKERFRAYKEFDKQDCEILDRIVDEEMNKLLRDLQGLPEGDRTQ